MRKFLGGMAMATILKLLFYTISTAIKLIANIMVFFGLYVPFFYLMYGELLILFAGFTIVPYNAEVGLFVFGLVISLFCSVIITVRNLIVNPVKAVFGRNDKTYKVKYKERLRPSMDYHGGAFPRPRRRYIAPPRRSEQYGYLTIDSPREYMNRLDSFYERPDVYRSEINPSIIVYEYHDRFDLYRHNGNRLEFIESKYR